MVTVIINNLKLMVEIMYSMPRVRIASVHLLHLLENKIRIGILMSNFLSRIKVSNNNLIQINLHYLIIVSVLTKTLLIDLTFKGTYKLNSSINEMADTKFPITILVSFRVKALIQDNNQRNIIEIFQLIMLDIREDNSCLTGKLPKNKPPS